MEVSSVYSELRLYRYAASTEVDGDSNYSYNKSFIVYDNQKKTSDEKNETSSTPKKSIDTVEISEAASKYKSPDNPENQSDEESKDSSKQNKPTTASTDETLSEEDLKTVEKLKKRDNEVRSHEAAHLSAGGNLVRGGASYSYQTGPDGKQYAIGGEVKIDTSAENDPQATINKMQQVKRTALAPANPSSQDRSVAQMASSQEAQARAELSKTYREDSSNKLQEVFEAFDKNNSNEKNQEAVIIDNKPTNEKLSTTDEIKKNNKLVEKLISSYKSNQDKTGESIGKLINKTDTAPSIESLKLSNNRLDNTNIVNSSKSLAS